MKKPTEPVIPFILALPFGTLVGVLLGLSILWAVVNAPTVTKPKPNIEIIRDANFDNRRDKWDILEDFNRP